MADESPALSPDDALKTFYMPPGYHLELVASEPLVQDPIVIDWDRRRPAVGRRDARVRAGSRRRPSRTSIRSAASSCSKTPNNDGKMDKRTVFADGLVLRAVAEGARPRRARRRAAERLADARHQRRSEDGHQGARRPTSTAGAKARVEQNANSFYWGARQLDAHGRTATSILRLKDGKFEVRKTLSRGEWGVTQDDAGRDLPEHERVGAARRLRADAVLRAQPEPAAHARQLRSAARRRRTTSTWSGRCGRIPAPIAPISPASIAPTARSRSSRRSARRWSIAAIGCRRSCTATCSSPSPPPTSSAGSSSTTTARRCAARKAYDQGEFLASTDERFRPVYLSNAPDGTLYIVDMYRGIIQQRADITRVPARPHPQAQARAADRAGPHLSRRARDDAARHRRRRCRRRRRRSWSTTLSHPNGWWRDTAQRLLVERGDKSVAPELAKLAARTAKDWRTRLHALWTLDGIDAIEPATVIKALDDPSRDVRVSAIRIAERWLGDAESAGPGRRC